MRSEEWAGQEVGVVWGRKSPEEEPGFFLEAFTGHEEGEQRMQCLWEHSGPCLFRGLTSVI